MYEYRDVADYYSAAQTYIGWRGLPYEMILEELTSHPDMEARDVAEMIIEMKSELLSQPSTAGRIRIPPSTCSSGR